MRKRRLLFPLVVAAALRLSGLGWDGWYHQHPDERFLVMVAEKLAFPKGLGEALDPDRTPLNPQNREFAFFVYGALFPSLNFTAARILGMAHYTGLLKTGRALAVLFDCSALLLLALTARRLAGAAVGEAVAWLYAFAGVLVQNARFGTADASGLFAVSLALFACLGPVSVKGAALAGLGVGLAAATRPNLVSLALPVTVAILLMPLPAAPRRTWLRRLGLLVLAGGVALAVWKLLDPGFFASIASPFPHPRRIASFRELAAMMQGEGQYPPNLQWADRGFLFLLWNYAFWGVGPALGLGMVWAAAIGARRLVLGDRRTIVLLSWIVPYALVQATRFVGSVRHFLPATPFLLLLLALPMRKWRPLSRRLLVGLTVPWGLAWAAIAWQPYTRLEASSFLRRTFPEGTVIASEAWDDGLPMDFGAERFRYREIPVYAPDTQDKREELLSILKEAQVVALSSQRGVGSVCRVPDAYPLTSEFYHLLFSGQLGFRLVFHTERKLGWGRWGLSHLAAEEALSVYDHPPVWIFAKEQGYDHALVTQLLARVRLPADTGWHTRDLQARGLPPYLVRHQRPEPLPASWGTSLWGQGVSLLVWLLALEWIGLLATAWLHLHARLDAQTAALLGRPVGVLAVGMAVLWGGSLHLPGWQAPLWVAAGLFASWKARHSLRELLFTAEVRWARVLFLLCFAGFLLIRACNPEIYWGEKPMDSAIFTLLLRSPALPPQDPWFAGYPINYYFFGFLPYVFLTELAGAAPGVAFNLATATVPALAFVAAGACGWLISQRRAGAWLSGTLTQLAGTAYLLIRPAHLAAPNFDRFWASSRVIAEGINEYPVWTALFADLHAHFLSIPGFLSALTLFVVLLRRDRVRGPLVLPVSLVLASQYMSNTWEVPALALLLAASVALSFGRRSHGLARGLAFVVATGLAAALMAWPFVVNQHLPRGSLFWEKGQSVTFWQYFELYGVHGTVFLLMLLAGWSSLGSRRLKLFVATVGLVAFVFAVGPRYFTLVDKMNSYFKLGLQVFLLLGAVGGGLWAVSSKAVRHWPRRVAHGLASLLLAAGLLHALWDAWAVVMTRRVPGPRPTLDGQAYLPSAQPEVAAAVRSCRTHGLSPVAEEATPSYADNLRLPMFCGVPAVVGWDYHLWQRGKAQAEIRLRLDDLHTLLRGEPQELARALARRYQVRAMARWGEPPTPPAGFVPVPGTQGRLWVAEEP